VVRRQHILAHHPPRPFGLAVTARANGEIERRGGNRRLPPRRVAHFDRAPELDRHGELPKMAGWSGFGTVLAACKGAVTARRDMAQPQLILSPIDFTARAGQDCARDWPAGADSPRSRASIRNGAPTQERCPTLPRGILRATTPCRWRRCRPSASSRM